MAVMVPNKPLTTLSLDDLGPEYPTVSNPEQVSEWEKNFYCALYRQGIRPIPQYAVEKYVLDFALSQGDCKLNIEIDGERSISYSGNN